MLGLLGQKADNDDCLAIIFHIVVENQGSLQRMVE